MSALFAAAPTLLMTLPALAAPLGTSYASIAIPTAFALGAGGFAVLSALLLRRWRRQSAAASDTAFEQMAGLRARLDEYEAVLSGLPELTVLWSDPQKPPRILGQVSAILPAGRQPGSLLDLHSWLGAADAERLGRELAALKFDGTAFDLSFTALHGPIVRVAGRILGGTVALRLRLAGPVPKASEEMDIGALTANLLAANPPEQTRLAVAPQGALDSASVQSILGLFNTPAFVRGRAGDIIYGNQAYRQLVRKLHKSPDDRRTDPVHEELVDIFDADQRRAQRAILEDQQAGTAILVNALPAAGSLDLIAFRLADGVGGILRSSGSEAATFNAGLGHIAPVINTLSTPIAIFDGNQKLLHVNGAYARLWDLDEAWLASGPDERAILDRLRTHGRLPAEPDYRLWRTEHLKSYSLASPRQTQWNLPGGRTLEVTAAPATTSGGVIYVFDDLTEHFELVSRNKSQANVQRETINALSEGVAVFGTNGRLALHNPRFAWLWSLPADALGGNPHINRIAAAANNALPEDGTRIWADLTQSVINLDPNRDDRSGRISRSDQRLLDYAIIRLPDGQTMMTFVDVTESAGYEQVLRERNEALVAADQLKDAFVQNVSYELRSPLTNIIGFADLLAAGDVGPLNDRQRAYTDYIRASSATLGVLIDNILDLTNIDAGIAELKLEPQDIAALVDRARIGLVSSVAGNDQQPDLTIDIDDNLPEFVADGTRIVQVLYNLLANAVRYAGAGSAIRLGVHTRPGRILFSVEDDGAGLSDDERVDTIARFKNQTGHGRQRGDGLGLTLAQAFVNMHGGTLSIEPRQPHGTRVIVNLPANAAKAAQVS